MSLPSSDSESSAISTSTTSLPSVSFGAEKSAADATREAHECLIANFEVRRRRGHRYIWFIVLKAEVKLKAS